ncbi:hypothetical protein BOSEA31B_14635 [Hyphomicrobiales bacterium]|nr:hypothetical protein BOSEA31B_14635 [Hyphomicrobiales bacterium]CAH1701127.1 hypothetical protein BOSEA1005_20826 [Hyphomicrobiales bacterium]CAI0345092.1 hypothetical protein BO1005MUT1_370002 [Hyphomicrobiales bacterium]
MQSHRNASVPTFFWGHVHPGKPETEDPSIGSELDFDVDAGGEIELHEGVDRLGSRIDNVEDPLVGPHLELLARLLVDVGRAVDGELLDERGQRNRSADLGARPLRGRHDLARRGVEDTVIERLEADPNVLTVHGLVLSVT